VAGGEEVELDLGGTSLSLRVADDVRIEVEVEVDGDEYELELGMVTSVRCLAGRGRTYTISGDATLAPKPSISLVGLPGEPHDVDDVASRPTRTKSTLRSVPS